MQPPLQPFYALMVFVLLAGTGNSLGQSSSPAAGIMASVMAHYNSEEDSLAREAARFLLDNAEGHGYAIYDLQDSSGNVVPFDALGYATYEELEAAFDSLEAQHGTLDFARRETITDSAALTPEFLIHHVD